MKILLDECVPRPLARYLEDHQVQTVPQAGWASTVNGPLIRLAESEFDVFITVDKGNSLPAEFELDGDWVCGIASPQ